ncbi:MAG TPA: hypothetical protein VKE96_25450 [Vicinamibacterales bacterium]|nr:hypothetical protein [Vicinamibacterales bacterium]
MNEPEVDLEMRRRVLFVLHRGWVEARLLAAAGLTEQLRELADALEPIPRLLWLGQQDWTKLVRLNLSVYEERYRGRCFEYLATLDGAEVLEF